MTKKSQIFSYFKNDGEIPEASKDVFVGVLPESISGVKDLFEALFNVLFFPGYFGFNWNALSDCLRDFHWLDEKTVILAHKDIPQLPKDELWEYFDILYFCINDWTSNEDHKLMVMFPEECRRQIAEILD